MAPGVALAAALGACQEPAARRTCRLRAARPEIVQEGNSGAREANGPSFRRALAWFYSSAPEEGELAASFQAMAASRSACQVNPRLFFTALGKTCLHY